MSYTEQFVIINNLQPGDAILLKKKFMGMLNHFAVYLGRDRYTNKPLFAANYTKGVEILEEGLVLQFLQTLEPEKIERFYGTNQERMEAVKRAIQMRGRPYDLITNNCEHYKNYVQRGERYSKQVDDFGKTAMVEGGLAAIAGAATNNNKAVGWGLFALALGAIAAGSANNDK
jgi:hypothetical protein